MVHRFLILLIDDDPSLIDILKRASSTNFPEASFVHVLSCDEAKQYIKDLNGYGPKLVLLDLDLGGRITGIDFLAFLSSHPEARFLPIVMLTINELPVQIKQAYEAGVTAFTVKPFSFGEWKLYMSNLRDYWFKTAALPRIYFTKQIS